MCKLKKLPTHPLYWKANPKQLYRYNRVLAHESPPSQDPTMVLMKLANGHTEQTFKVILPFVFTSLPGNQRIESNIQFWLWGYLINWIHLYETSQVAKINAIPKAYMCMTSVHRYESKIFLFLTFELIHKWVDDHWSGKIYSAILPWLAYAREWHKVLHNYTRILALRKNR